MKRLNLPLITDTFFSALCAFLLFFTTIRYYTKSAVLGLIFGAAAALLFGALSFIYISGKMNKSLLLSRDEKNKKLLSLHLSLSSDEYLLKLIKSALGENAKIRGKRVICDDVSYFFNFKMQPLCEDDIAKLIKFKTENKKCVFCNLASHDAAALAEHFAITVKGIDEVFALLKKNNLLPEKYVYEDAAKPKFFSRIKARFNRKICAPLFWSGAALLALSYFTFFPIYYIVSGGIMLILSAFALVINRG
ncbi:MAG: hypothetical protein K2K80_06160 [Clostridia bacterium]|nr:hypothetical protein [Clostridia bacterium]